MHWSGASQARQPIRVPPRGIRLALLFFAASQALKSTPAFRPWVRTTTCMHAYSEVGTTIRGGADSGGVAGVVGEVDSAHTCTTQDRVRLIVLTSTTPNVYTTENARAEKPLLRPPEAAEEFLGALLRPPRGGRRVFGGHFYSRLRRPKSFRGNFYGRP